MSVNPYLRVFSANGYFDAVTLFLQTILSFESMPVASRSDLDRLTVRNYRRATWSTSTARRELR